MFECFKNKGSEEAGSQRAMEEDESETIGKFKRHYWSGVELERVGRRH